MIIKELYYVLMYNGLGNAKECRTLIKHGEISVNGTIVTNHKYLISGDDKLVYRGNSLKSDPFVYYMLNKPKGYICANKDVKYPCVGTLVPKTCSCLGRLDIDTTGLLILTNDRTLVKKLLLPQNHVQKKYLVTLKEKLTRDLVAKFSNGVIIDKQIRCLPADLKIIDDYHCFVTICEGKYHQIKKMFLSCHNCVTALKRVEFASIKLDETLALGAYRPLKKEEIKKLVEENK